MSSGRSFWHAGASAEPQARTLVEPFGLRAERMFTPGAASVGRYRTFGVPSTDVSGCVSPREENEPRPWPPGPPSLSSRLAATEMTHGWTESTFILQSPAPAWSHFDAPGGRSALLAEPSLPAAKTTVTPASWSFLVACGTTSVKSARSEPSVLAGPHELLTARMLSSGWARMSLNAASDQMMESPSPVL